MKFYRKGAICYLCHKVAVVLDGFYPYETFYNRCVDHKDKK